MTAAFARSVRAEIAKLRTVRSTLVIFAVGFVLSIGFGLLVAFAPRNRRRVAANVLPPHGTPKWFLDSLSVFGSIALPLALVVGALIVTSEYRHKTVTSTFLAEPRRTMVVASKLFVGLLAGFAVGVAAAAGALVLGFVMVAASTGTPQTMLGQYQSLLGYLAAAALYALYGAGLGALLKNQIFTLVAGLGFDLVLLPILSATVPGFARWMPSQAAQALASATVRTGFAGSSVHLVTWWAGVLVLLAWGIVLAGLGASTAVRADIT
jgi:ABC-type transport system involved in multi-copper enzyme maturation permease subunit